MGFIKNRIDNEDIGVAVLATIVPWRENIWWCYMKTQRNMSQSSALQPKFNNTDDAINKGCLDS